MSIETPFNRATATVLPDWIDYNGHMNVGYYHVVFDIAAEPFFEWLGLTADYRREHGASTFALESHLHFLREVTVDAPLRFEARLLDFDHKRIHFYQEMFHATEGYLAACYESVSAHVDFKLRRTAPMAAELQSRLADIKAAHQALARPWMIGHVISAHPPARKQAAG
ncbi:MAG: thioesterase family protein [Burkholderiaceae bacterium]